MSTDYFLPDDPGPIPAAHSYWGGAERGCVVALNFELADDQVLVDDGGHRITVAELRALAGTGKTDPERDPSREP